MTRLLRVDRAGMSSLSPAGTFQSGGMAILGVIILISESAEVGL
jgi:hypothetical protein